MNVSGNIADADGDIAALVYSNYDRPDLVLCAFAESLASAHMRLCGLVQFRDRLGGSFPGRALCVDSGREIEVLPTHDAAGSNCRLDSLWLDKMGNYAQASIRRGVDMVIVNRFGPLEAAGRGFYSAILTASETETPLIVAVPEFEFERWTRFSGGMAVRLDCTLDGVLNWWRQIQGSSPQLAVSGGRACERFK